MLESEDLVDEVKVKELLIKITALKKQAATEGEAQAAAAAVQRLLLKYNLSLSEVLLERGEGTEDSGIVTEQFRFSDYYKSKTWKQQLLFGIGSYNFVKALMHGDNQGSFIGKPENVLVARQLFDYLCEELERLSYDELYKAQGYERRPRGKWQWAKVGPNTIKTHGRTWRQAVLLGAVHRLKQRMADNYWAVVDEERSCNASQVTALITLNETAIDEYVKSQWPRLRKVSLSNNIGDWQGYQNGQKVAEQVSLEGRAKQLGGSKKLLEN